MKVYICSPLRGDYERNIQMAIRYCRAVALRGDIPIAPHIYCTQFLDDKIEKDRMLGMDIGLKMLEMCDCMLAYGEHISDGMRREIDRARELKIPVRYVREEI